MIDLLKGLFALLLFWMLLWPLLRLAVAKMEPGTYRRYGLTPPKRPVIVETGWRTWALKATQYALLVAVYVQIRDGFGPESGQAAFWAALAIVYAVVYWLGRLIDAGAALRRRVWRRAVPAIGSAAAGYLPTGSASRAIAPPARY